MDVRLREGLEGRRSKAREGESDQKNMGGCTKLLAELSCTCMYWACMVTFEVRGTPSVRESGLDMVFPYTGALTPSLSLEEIDGIVLNKTVNKRKNLAFVLVLDKTSRFGLAD